MSETKSDHNNNISKKTVIDNYNVLKCSNDVLMASKSKNICIKRAVLNQHLEMAAKLEKVMECHDLPFYVSSNGHFFKGT